ncbi:hypothetical protein BOTNAR_0523g00030 [Botryotinia narcissicola]|uniref:Uncharacterized protein n=1 Tax=Botryotinia narcissicola TaxID=278944 RepID=A0A4Z1HEP6_9HELO|nr:hypothetical protein BOTNAR_0523g00030 [Botryotinia narcissicola]
MDSVPQNLTSYANQDPNWTRALSKKAGNLLLETHGAGKGVEEYAKLEGRLLFPVAISAPTSVKLLALYMYPMSSNGGNVP